MRQQAALALCASAFVAGALPAVALAAPPANDDFANAQVLVGTSFSVNGTNGEATAEVGEPAHAGQGPERSVWYSWAAPLTETVSIDTCPSSFDTVLAVYTGAAVNALAGVASNDDSDACPGSQSRVTFAVAAGTTYRIAVDGFGGQTGNITLRLVRPANDLFANSRVLSGFSASALGTNVNATAEAGEPAHAGAPARRSVWYRWTAPGGGFASVGTCASSFDTRLGIYTGTSVGALTGVAGNDDARNCGRGSLAGFLANAGTTYRMAVDGNGGAQGSFNLKVKQSRPGRYRGKTEFLDARRVSLRIPSDGRTIRRFTFSSELSCSFLTILFRRIILGKAMKIRPGGKFSSRSFVRFAGGVLLIIRVRGELLPPDRAKGHLKVTLRIPGLGRCKSFPANLSWRVRRR